MNILITGSRGFMGGWVMRALNAKGSEKNLLRFYNAWDEIRGMDKVFHFAAVKKNLEYHKKYPADILSDNFAITNNVLRACVDHKVKSVVLISSVVAENPDSEHYGYSWSKKIDEVLGEAYKRQFGLNVITLRVPNCFGEYDNFGENSQVIPSFIKRIHNGEKLIIEDGPKKDFIYAGDMVKQVVEATESRTLIPTFSISLKELAERLHNISDDPIDTLLNKTKQYYETQYLHSHI